MNTQQTRKIKKKVKLIYEQDAYTATFLMNLPYIYFYSTTHSSEWLGENYPHRNAAASQDSGWHTSSHNRISVTLARMNTLHLMYITLTSDLPRFTSDPFSTNFKSPSLVFDRDPTKKKEWRRKERQYNTYGLWLMSVFSLTSSRFVCNHSSIFCEEP